MTIPTVFDMSIVRLQVSIDTDANPEKYYKKVFKLHKRYWHLVDTEEENKIVVQSTYVYPDDDSIPRIVLRYSPQIEEETELTLLEVM